MQDFVLILFKFTGFNSENLLVCEKFYRILMSYVSTNA